MPLTAWHTSFEVWYYLFNPLMSNHLFCLNFYVLVSLLVINRNYVLNFGSIFHFEISHAYICRQWTWLGWGNLFVELVHIYEFTCCISPSLNKKYHNHLSFDLKGSWVFRRTTLYSAVIYKNISLSYIFFKLL